MSPIFRFSPLLIALAAAQAHAVDVNIIQHHYPNQQGSRYQYPSGYNNAEPRISLPYTGPVPARDRMEYMQQYMEQNKQELKDEKDPPLTRSEFEEILDRKLEEKLAKKKAQAPEAEAPSPFGPIGGLGPVGGPSLGPVGPTTTP